MSVFMPAPLVLITRDFQHFQDCFGYLESLVGLIWILRMDFFYFWKMLLGSWQWFNSDSIDPRDFKKGDGLAKVIPRWPGTSSKIKMHGGLRRRGRHRLGTSEGEARGHPLLEHWKSRMFPGFLHQREVPMGRSFAMCIFKALKRFFLSLIQVFQFLRIC